MSAEEKDLPFDVRVIERNLKRGTVDKKDYEKYLKSLDDEAKDAKTFDAQQPGAPKAPPEK